MKVVSMLIDRLYALQNKNFSVRSVLHHLAQAGAGAVEEAPQPQIDRVNKYQENAAGDQNK